MSENKVKTKVIIPYLFSFIFLLTSYLIYTLVPSSELANSVEHSGMDAVYALTASPVFAFLSLITLVLSYVLNRTYLNGVLPKLPAYIGHAVIAAMILLSFIFSVLFVISQFKLGFTAPINDTVWNSYGIFILFSVIVEFVFAVLLTLVMKGIIIKKSK